MPAKTTFSLTITISADNAGDATRKAQALTTIGNLIDTDNLEMLARKAAKPGVNQKIKAYAPFM